jgi:solute carrier family 6 (neurotransmitter transporter, glycine) member 5/9
MIVGQFSSRGTIKVYDCSPAMRGVGTGQVLSSIFVATYYSSIMGLTLKYLYDSFNFALPWATCKPEWGPSCFSTVLNKSANVNVSSQFSSSAKLYFE